jgi:hypothetical protein
VVSVVTGKVTALTSAMLLNPLFIAGAAIAASIAAIAVAAD